MKVPLSIRLRHRLCTPAARGLATVVPNFSGARLCRPIFLIGCGRSGTTLLNNLLRLHRDVAAWSEANEILDPLWYPWRATSAHRPPMEFDPVQFTTDWWHSIQPYRDWIRGCFGAYQWLQRKPVFINKSPFNTFRLPHLLELFPGARFIHITRDGRAAVYSYARKLTEQNKFVEWPEPQRTIFRESFDEFLVWLSRFWQLGHLEVRAQDDALRLAERGALLELRYETLCARPDATLSEICRFLNIDADRFVRRPEVREVESRNTRWQAVLSTSVVERMVEAMQPSLGELDYVRMMPQH